MTFVIKHRGAPAIRMTFADYFCEKHGRFEAQVERDDQGDVPASMPCPHEILEDYFCGDPPALCGKKSEYCISAPLAKVRAVEAIKGKWQAPERKTWTDTRDLGEGMDITEWREKRAAVWEEKRKEDVMRFARENYERPIGGD